MALPTPRPSPSRVALINRTNDPLVLPSARASLPTPPEHALAKRPHAGADSSDATRIKRVKLCLDDMVEPMDCDSDEDRSPAVIWRPKNTIYHRLSARASSRPGAFPHQTLLPAHSTMRSFVSSHTADVFSCRSGRVDSFVTPPYACAYTHAAKRGGAPRLAVATEEGTVFVWDTARRTAEDAVPQRIDLQTHDNGIFDVQWSTSDTFLATSAGDHTTRITDPNAAKTVYILSGHKSTVKSAVWDPAHEQLLSTGGRDGSICVWDLRSSGRCTQGNMSPVMCIKDAHIEDQPAKGRGKKSTASVRTVTSLLYSDMTPCGLISSGSFDGILRYWDLRQSTPPKKSRSTKPPNVLPLYTSSSDPTTVHGARRPRGITSVVAGTGPSAGLLFGLGIDSCVHTYAASTLHPLSSSFTHSKMLTNSFYVRLSMSPDGRTLAAGSTGGSAFLYDVSCASLANLGEFGGSDTGVELASQRGEVGAVDWADGMLATCSDDGTVRVWRSDEEVRRRCTEDDAHWNWAWAVDQESR
ncbi:WD40 repeat-like protein [Auriscalpium vulgare]|uniref:WD40 repeat-like protein n=1 Tax=Auriscalpium vulgare TaxID=40419 RepID=A0ACB8R9Y5_9AGAM|nr:WD40 repeat-like protein [Auriscalpium vulgare]